MTPNQLAQQQIVKGPHRWDAEKKEYVATGPTPPAPGPVGVSAKLAAVLRGPHRFIPGEGGEAGRYVAVSEPKKAPAPPAAAPPIRPAGPPPGQPIFQRPK